MDQTLINAYIIFIIIPIVVFIGGLISYIYTFLIDKRTKFEFSNIGAIMAMSLPIISSLVLVALMIQGIIITCSNLENYINKIFNRV